MYVLCKCWTIQRRVNHHIRQGVSLNSWSHTSGPMTPPFLSRLSYYPNDQLLIALMPYEIHEAPLNYLSSWLSSITGDMLFGKNDGTLNIQTCANTQILSDTINTVPGILMCMNYIPVNPNLLHFTIASFSSVHSHKVIWTSCRNSKHLSKASLILLQSPRSSSKRFHSRLPIITPP